MNLQTNSMNTIETIGFIISTLYMFYILWWKFPVKYFYERKFLIINIVISFFYAFLGFLLNFSVKSGIFLVPIFLILFIHLFNTISKSINNQQFLPAYKTSYYIGESSFLDFMFTLPTIIFSYIIPIILVNYFFTGNFFDN